MNRRLILICLLLFIVSAGMVEAGIYLDIRDTKTIRLTNTPSDETFVLLLETPGGVSELPEADAIQEAVRMASAEFRLPESLIYSIIRGGRGIGAGGLMVLPDFVAEDMTDTALQDPRINVREGTRHLQSVIDHFKGNLTLALSAYIAGIKKVEEAGGIPDRQARDFVENVRAAFDQYDRRTEIIYSYRDEKGVLTLINIR
ncbi:MAG: lytic transglycosylase domain-containing protein [bacterium]